MILDYMEKSKLENSMQNVTQSYNNRKYHLVHVFLKNPNLEVYTPNSVRIKLLVAFNVWVK